MRTLLRHLLTWQKLVLLVAPAALLAVAAAILHVSDLRQRAQHAARAPLGITRVAPALETVRLLQQHRGLSNGVLAGNAQLEPRRAAVARDLQAAIEKLGVSAAATSAGAATEAEAVAESARRLADSVARKAMDGKASFAAHTALVARMLGLVESFLDAYTLTADEDLANHYLVQASYRHLPDIAESLGQARALGTAILSAKAASAAERASLVAVADRARRAVAALAVASAKAGDGGLAAADTTRALEERARQALDAIERDVLVEAPSADAAAYFNVTTGAIDAAFAHGDALSRELAARLGSAAQRLARQTTVTTVVLGLLLLATALFVVVVSRAITVPLAAAGTAAREIAAGNLAARVDDRGRDEPAMLLRTLGEMKSQLVAMVARIQASSHAIRNAAAQTAAGNTDLSSRTEEQASSIEETAANLEELTTTVRHNAQGARAVLETADAAVTQARDGSARSARIAESMDGIAETAGRIQDLAKGIDAIAFQTNLLALNAAVEAARAGEHGRGFAVVAAEVRALSQRCADASREIRSLAGTSTERIARGRQEASEASAAIAAIEADIASLATRVKEIAAASDQQRAGIEQINQAVVQMESVTQQNAALVEQAAAAAMSLDGQAAELMAATGVFRIDANAHEATPDPLSAAFFREPDAGQHDRAASHLRRAHRLLEERPRGERRHDRLDEQAHG